MGLLWRLSSSQDCWYWTCAERTFKLCWVIFCDIATSTTPRYSKLTRSQNSPVATSWRYLFTLNSIFGVLPASVSFWGFTSFCWFLGPSVSIQKSLKLFYLLIKLETAEAYLQPCQTSMMAPASKYSGLMPLTIFRKALKRIYLTGL